MTMNLWYLSSPVGDLTLLEEEEHLTGLHFGRCAFPQAQEIQSPLLHWAEEELADYFAGKRKAFSLPLSGTGTPFQQAVWKALQEIPYGTVCSYGDIAKAVGRPKACRAVGMANHNNPLAILVPCHRVVGAGYVPGADKGLTGYAGGLDTKRFLLRLEQSNQ